MPENIKFGLIGGDKRTLVCASLLSREFECAVWGLSGVYGTPDEKYLRNTVRCADFESAVRGSSAVILPLPTCRGGENLFCPLRGERETGEVKLTDICDKMKIGQTLFGGNIPPFLKRYAAEHGIEVIDYYDSEELQIKNAVPTAEGAIGACIDTLPVTVAGMRCAVLGYGRCGRCLALKLKSLGADVTVAARSERDRANAFIDGCTPIRLDEFRKAPPVGLDAVFNTIPFPVFDEELLSLMSSDSVIFELSSGMGDYSSAAGKFGIKVVPLPSLPGKVAPVTAGRIVYEVLRRLIGEHFQSVE